MPKVIFNVDKCKGCELCISVCPKGILMVDKDKINIKGFHPVKVTEQDKCIGCAFCATICPDVVITIEK